jgi:chromate reductase, NAD(P)H dehydrogenase (quinone)
MTPKLLAFAGSLRTASYNKKLVRIAAEGARAVGAQIMLLDLRELPMPLYDGDIEKEQGLPQNARRFKQLLIEHHGILLSTPEYNSQYPAVLKNAIDWASRREGDEAPLVAFRGKVAGVMSASNGMLAGLRSQTLIRSLLLYLGMVVVPIQIGIARAAEAFDESGRLKDDKQHASIEALGAEVARFATRLI